MPPAAAYSSSAAARWRRRTGHWPSSSRATARTPANTTAQSASTRPRQNRARSRGHPARLPSRVRTSPHSARRPRSRPWRHAAKSCESSAAIHSRAGGGGTFEPASRGLGLASSRALVAGGAHIEQRMPVHTDPRDERKQRRADDAEAVAYRPPEADRARFREIARGHRNLADP